MASTWNRNGPYLVADIGAWRVELLVGTEDFGTLSTPCDANLYSADGSRYYGTFASPDLLAAVIANLGRQGEQYLSLNTWILVPDMSEVYIEGAVRDIVANDLVAVCLERMEP